MDMLDRRLALGISLCLGVGCGDAGLAQETELATSATTTGATSEATTGTSTGDTPTSTSGTANDATETGEASTTGDDTDSAGSSGATTAIPADCSIVEFPDPLLEAAVREAIDLPVGAITSELLAPLDYLAIGNADGLVVSLVGLQCATGLRDLRLSGEHGQGGDFLAPIAGLTQLDSLFLDRVLYGELAHVAGLTKLTRLTLRDTGVVDLSPLAAMVLLDSIDLNSNAVTDLSPLVGLSSLRSLNLRANAITDLGPLAGLTTLEDLNISATPVAELGPLAGLVGLRYLVAHFSEIEDLGPLSGLSQLDGLNLDNTPVSDLSPLAGLPIRYFSASGCSITDISPVASWPTPGQIDLSQNDIVELDGLLAADWLVAEPYCGEVHLTGNPLSPAALTIVSQLCSATKVGIFADGGTCEGYFPCPMP